MKTLPESTILALVCSCAISFGQTADPAAHVFHPSAPLPSYNVATIKPLDPASATAPNGMRILRGSSTRQLIQTAYSPTSAPLAPSQVIGGPEWIDKDEYIVNGKPSADLEVAMKKMKTEDQTAQQHAMQQSLLADRFHLKVHFEVREMPVYALVPAKGGLKIKQVEPPAPRDPSSPPLPPPSPNTPIRPGTMMMMMGAGGATTVRAGATTMASLASLVGRQLRENGDRPVIDQTGFTGNFDIDNLTWAPLGSANASDSTDLPPLATALEETLGIKVVATKGPVEIVVIDSIDHPTEN